MHARNATADVARRIGGSVVSAATIIGALLIPKCPLCVAAALSTFGLGVAAAHWLAPFVRIFGFALGALSVLGVVYFEWRRRRLAPCESGCRGHRVAGQVR
jgi:hypothetical protein